MVGDSRELFLKRPPLTVIYCKRSMDLWVLDFIKQFLAHLIEMSNDFIQMAIDTHSLHRR